MKFKQSAKKLSLIIMVYFFSLFHICFAQNKEVIWDNSLDPNFPFTVSIFDTNQGLLQNQIDDFEVKDANNIYFRTLGGIMKFNGSNFEIIANNKKIKNYTFRKLVYCKKKNILFAIDNLNNLYQIFPTFKQINLNSEIVISSILNEDDLISVCQSGNLYSTNILSAKTNFLYKIKEDKFLINLQYQKSMVVNYPFIYLITLNGILKLNLLSKSESIILSGHFFRLAINPFNKSVYALSQNSVFRLTPFVHKFKIQNKIDLQDITFKNKTDFYLATLQGLVYLENGQQFLFNDKKCLPTTRLHSCYFDTDFQNLYLGSIDKGLLKLTYKNLKVISKGDTMIESSASSVIKTKSGKLLFVQSIGNIVEVERNTSKLFSNTQFKIFSLAADENYIYAGTLGHGLIVLKDKIIIKNILPPNISGNSVYAFFIDSRKNIWVANDKGVSCGKGLDELFPFSNSIIKTQITCIYELKDGSICLGGIEEMYIIHNRKISVIKSPNPDFYFKRIRSFYEDSNGKIWIASYGGGLFCYVKNQLISINSIKNVKLPNDIFTLCKDNFGHFYMSSNNGLWRVSEKKLNDLLENKINYLIPFYYNRVNGLNNSEFNGGFQNNFLKVDSALYFPGIGGLVKVIPESIKANILVTCIDEVFINDSLVNLEKKIFQRNENSVRFKVTCSTIESKFNVWFQYKLIQTGLEDWSPLLKSNEFNFKSLQPGKYKFVVRAIDAQNLEHPIETNFTFQIVPYFYETIWFQILFGTLFILIVFLVLNRIKNNRIHKEILNKEIAQLELNEIQSQMNPHFIFNAMNNIKYFLKINENKVAEVNLGHLSKLLRKFIDYSNNDYIEIENEVQLLTSYVEIERMRFSNKFTFGVNLPEELKNHLMPTYILQPLIENAIKHGIMPSENMHHIQLSFLQEGQQIIITIDDDGIGRDIASKNVPAHHKSKGIKMIRKKIILLKERFNIDVQLEIVDKEIGTQIIIRIPIIL